MAVTVAVIIPALNEAPAIPLVLHRLFKVRLGRTRDGSPIEVSRVIVVDNGSRDDTARVAASAGAEVLSEPQRGYGRACLTGIAALAADPPGIVAFLDADASDDPDLLADLVRPIADDERDFVLGSRLLGECEPGALLPQARYGNRLSVWLIHLLYGFRYTDLGPFRAMRYSSLVALGMRDETFGWTAEMQVKAVRARLRIAEVPVSYRRRVGTSKITGTLSGTIRAGMKIIWTVLRYSRS
jgi:glycosyltransferase involved in cell wall biosynthesis